MVFSMSQLEAIRGALALSPENLALRTLYADRCLQEGAWEEAQLAFDEILTRDPGHLTPFDRATEEALFEANKRGRLIHLTTRRLLAAIRKVKPTPPPWFEEAERHARYANESGFYDDILDYLQQR